MKSSLIALCLAGAALAALPLRHQFAIYGRNGVHLSGNNAINGNIGSPGRIVLEGATVTGSVWSSQKKHPAIVVEDYLTLSGQFIVPAGQKYKAVLFAPPLTRYPYSFVEETASIGTPQICPSSGTGVFTAIGSGIGAPAQSPSAIQYHYTAGFTLDDFRGSVGLNDVVLHDVPLNIPCDSNGDPHSWFYVNSLHLSGTARLTFGAGVTRVTIVVARDVFIGGHVTLGNAAVDVTIVSGKNIVLEGAPTSAWTGYFVAGEDIYLSDGSVTGMLLAEGNVELGVSAKVTYKDTLATTCSATAFGICASYDSTTAQCCAANSFCCAPSALFAQTFCCTVGVQTCGATGCI